MTFINALRQALLAEEGPYVRLAAAEPAEDVVGRKAAAKAEDRLAIGAADATDRRVGRAYRETILGLGGSLSAYDVFRKFRGRKPSPKALLRQQGLA